MLRKGATSDSIKVTVNVINVDEPGAVSLSWKQPQVGTALEASLSDPDGSVSGVTWEWEKSTDKSDWDTISASTTSSNTPVVGDVGKYLRVTASYTDGEGSGKTAQRVSDRKVRAAPSGNSAPSFGDIEEISNTGYVCSGSDPDRGVCLYVQEEFAGWRRNSTSLRGPKTRTDDEVRYSLEGDDIAAFGVNPASGNLYTKQLFRDVDKGSYTVTIKASDPSGDSDTIKATIRPSGSKGSPVLEGPDEVRYVENGTWRVATYTAENERGPTGGWIISVQPGGGDGDHFHPSMTTVC